MCGGSPLNLVMRFIFVFLFVSLHVGEIHRRGVIIFNSRSPLFGLCFFVFGLLSIQLSGRLHRVGDIIYSRSPLSGLLFVVFSLSGTNHVVGENTQERRKFSFSPYEPKPVFNF